MLTACGLSRPHGGEKACQCRIEADQQCRGGPKDAKCDRMALAPRKWRNLWGMYLNNCRLIAVHCKTHRINPENSEMIKYCQLKIPLELPLYRGWEYRR